MTKKSIKLTMAAGGKVKATPAHRGPRIAATAPDCN